LFERPWIVTLTGFSVAETGERGEGETKLLQKCQAPFATRIAARWCDGNKPRARLLSFQKRDARERWPSAAARDQHSS
jgi:hypothetical protein